ncbi:hypothetical protein BSR02_15900 [Serratia liquefaciens]|nr:hypothetical protein BSR02_15900 [Serratia liquefaciens]
MTGSLCHHHPYPRDFKLRLGAQPVHPQELTKVSDWGEHVQTTTLRLERRRVSVILAQVVPLKG